MSNTGFQASSLKHYIVVWSLVARLDAVVTVHVTRDNIHSIMIISLLRSLGGKNRYQAMSQDVHQISSQLTHNSDFSIVTPVPLLYSARSKAVLDSMILSGSSGNQVQLSHL